MSARRSRRQAAVLPPPEAAPPALLAVIWASNAAEVQATMDQLGVSACAVDSTGNHKPLLALAADFSSPGMATAG